MDYTAAYTFYEAGDYGVASDLFTKLTIDEPMNSCVLGRAGGGQTNGR